MSLKGRVNKLEREAGARFGNIPMLAMHDPSGEEYIDSRLSPAEREAFERDVRESIEQSGTAFVVHIVDGNQANE